MCETLYVYSSAEVYFKLKYFLTSRYFLFLVLQKGDIYKKRIVFTHAEGKLERVRLLKDNGNGSVDVTFIDCGRDDTIATDVLFECVDGLQNYLPMVHVVEIIDFFHFGNHVGVDKLREYFRTRHPTTFFDLKIMCVRLSLITRNVSHFNVIRLM